MESMGFPGGAVVKNLPVSGFESSLGNIPWGRKWQPAPVVLPGKFHGQRSLGGLQSMWLQGVRHDWATTHTNRVIRTHELTAQQVRRREQSTVTPSSASSSVPSPQPLQWPHSWVSGLPSVLCVFVLLSSAGPLLWCVTFLQLWCACFTCSTWALEHPGSVVVTRELSSCGSLV